MKKSIAVMLVTAFAAMVSQPAVVSAADGEALFKSKCKMCHAIDKKKMGPAVNGMSTDDAVIKATITDGRKMMPAYGAKLSAEEIDSLVAFIKSQHK